MADLSALSQATTTALALSNLILVTPQKKVGYQAERDLDGPIADIESFLFHYEGDQSVTLQSDITDHFVEDNTSIIDHIGLRPEMIQVTGFIGELNNVVPPEAVYAKVARDKLILLSALTPELSIAGLQVYNNAQQLYSLYQNGKTTVNAVKAWGTVGTAQEGSIGTIDSNGNITKAVEALQTKQQLAFQKFYGYWRRRSLFKVQTPWAIFENCAIQSIRANQDADTEMFTSFEVTFKVVRFAKTIQVNATDSIFGDQSSEVDNKGLGQITEAEPVSDILG
jgi:hypothetical protein